MSTTSNGIDPSARLITPDGLPLAIIVTSVVFLGLSLVTVSLRTYIRLKKRTYGLDDAFMTIGTIVYIPVVGLAMYGCLVGLDRLNNDHNAWKQAEAVKYYVIRILLYVVALATVKSSVCITIRRIGSIKKSLKLTVWVLLAVTWASFLVTFVGTLLYCQPVRSLWTPALIISGKGSCAPVDVLLIIAHTATVSTILIDMALVIVPAVILWNTQMKRQAKIQAFGLFSFASLASIITMVRIPYVNKFESQTNLPFWVSHIIRCSNIETGISCFASSIPSLSHFFRRDSDGSSDPSSRRHISAGTKHMTPGSGSRRPRVCDSFRNPTDIGFNLSAVHHGRVEDTWDRLQDGASDKSDASINLKGIYAKRSYAVGVESATVLKQSWP